MDSNCFTFLESAAQTSAHCDAFSFSETHLNYEQFLARVETIAPLFDDLKPQARVGIELQSCSDYFAVLFAIWRSGGVAVPVSSEKLKTQIQLDFLVTKDSLTSCVKRTSRPARLSDPQELAAIIFTSGSSGEPKGVCLTHASLSRNAIETANRILVTATDKIFLNSPHHFTSTICHVLTMFSQHASVVSTLGFQFAEDYIKHLRSSRATAIGGVPTHFVRLTETVSADEALPEMKFFFSSGDHLPVPTIQKLRTRFPHTRLYCAYGLTEVGGRLCILDAEQVDAKKGSVGKPLPQFKIRVQHLNGELCKPGELGEVFVESNYLMAQYLGKAAITDFATGDIGYVDKEGDLYLQGRNDLVFKCGAQKVSAFAIEDLVRSLDFIADAIVTPVENWQIGKYPKLIYRLKPGKSFDKKAVIHAVRTQLDESHVPREFEEVSQMPQKPSGKLKRS